MCRNMQLREDQSSFFIINIQRFVNGDDAFRNSRFKLIPYISKPQGILDSKAECWKESLFGQSSLKINYFQGEKLLGAFGIDVGSSTVARGVVSLVLGYLNNLVIEMAFLIQGNTTEELPEFLLGTCRLNHLFRCIKVSFYCFNQ
ncbi:hypothetical protein Pfo_020604 [Paulownia fortunei]|nr:hypothetical protein Pfo_020604 [Paulownia fortunei]